MVDNQCLARLLSLTLPLLLKSIGQTGPSKAMLIISPVHLNEKEDFEGDS